MASILHANAKTTPRIRKEIQDSKESIAQIAKRLGLNPKTVLKWKHANSLEDNKSGPKIRSSVLTLAEQHIICEVRRQMQLSLDDLYIVLKPHIAKLSRSNLHRCLQHYGLSVLPKESSDKPKKKFKSYPIGYMHIDITEMRCEVGKQYLFVAIDRLTKYVYIELYSQMTAQNSVQFLKNLQAECPFKMTHILTDNGAQFTYNLLADHLKPKDKKHPFDALCEALNIEHRTTQFRHPWTNGMVEITNKTLKAATTKQFHYSTVEELKHHLMVYVMYYNHQRQLKSLKFKTPWQMIEQCYDETPEVFLHNPRYKTMGLNK